MERSGRHTGILAIIIYIVTLSIRIFHISFPKQAVFDEYHFGEFINNYYTGDFYFDIHPPFGKLVLFSFAKIVNYSGNIQFQEKYNDDFETKEYIRLRVGVSIFSSLTPVFTFFLLATSFSQTNAVLTSLLISFETSMMMEGRFILLDGILITLVSLHLLVLSRKTHTLLLGFTLGLCISTKNTALCLVPFTFYFMARKISILENMFIIVESIIVLLFVTALNLFLLPHKTSDAEMFLTPRIKNLTFTHRSSIHLFESAPLLLYQMHRLNMKNTQFHPYQSSPQSWPLLTGIGINFWDEPFEEMYEIGNPVVFYVGFIGVVISLFKFIQKIIFMKRLFFKELTIAEISSIGWVLGYFPFFLVPRTTFLYHYHIPLLFAIISTAYLPKKCLFAILLFAVMFYFYSSPILYGLPIQVKLPTIWLKGDSRHQGLVQEFFGI